MVYRSAVLLFSLLMLTNGGARADGIQSTEIAGTAFRVILKSGRELGPKDLLGAVIKLDLDGVGERAVRIDEVAPDPRARRARCYSTRPACATKAPDNGRTPAAPIPTASTSPSLSRASGTTRAIASRNRG